MFDPVIGCCSTPATSTGGWNSRVVLTDTLSKKLIYPGLLNNQASTLTTGTLSWIHYVGQNAVRISTIYYHRTTNHMNCLQGSHRTPYNVSQNNPLPPIA